MLYKCNKSEQMNVNLHLTGELETFVNELVKRGMVANKTEAIRMAIAKYYEEQRRLTDRIELPERSTINAHWNNPSDEKASEFYKKRYLL